MTRYSKEMKESIIQKMMPPNNVSVAQLKRETGITDATLYTWRKQAKAQGVAVPGDGKNPQQWSAENKFAVLMETANMNTTELSEYCRKKGLYYEDLQQWKADFIAGSTKPAESRQVQAAARRDDKKRIQKLEKELKRKDKALAETAALLVLTKKGKRDLGGARGRLIPLPDRKEAVALIQEAVSQGARKVKACAALNLSIRTVQRWQKDVEQVREDQRQYADRTMPANQLTKSEQNEILKVCNSERFKSKSPCQIVPTLADEGVYMASESSFYRVLKAHNQQHHRGRSQKPAKRKPTSHRATAPNQLWSWDITFLGSPIRGKYYYLYLVLDVYSRMIVTWEVHERESSDLAAQMIRKAFMQNKISLQEQPLVLHSDNGSPMKGATMLSTLQQLGVQTSFSRPRVSNDNSYSESGFRTMKYRPGYPNHFSSLESARKWVYGFVNWYNMEHKHSGIKFQTPYDRHTGKAQKRVLNRERVYRKAKEQHPERWGSRETRNWQLPVEVWLNPERSENQQHCDLAA
ncbi:IS3 family transposase [Endozoicomonas sp. 8E]|uniref:IS3 family transposase n=1 Tax=Endozoicomonas sp. 8E TaxID=3035692 RepID=UPI0029392BF8|nr:IS3 family transposase [Endozoicomonas sp. 8E]WOG26764.1 IS3 family transposase [Endozoicomonas sp. 8E]WOG30149.1 IS3 family transposase [Endozoicomonas sp. 8E]